MMVPILDRAVGYLAAACASELSILPRLPIAGRMIRSACRLLCPTDRLVWIRVKRGAAENIWLQIHPRVGADYWKGIAEIRVQRSLTKYLRPGMTVYDIGANFGFFTLIAARLVGDQGRVFAFDPEPECILRIQAGARRNGMDNVCVVRAAVWSVTGSVVFHRADREASPDRGLGHVGDDSNGTFRVQSIALDDFMVGNPPPDLIKCDAEGAEVHVFRGAETVLRRYRPTIICEVHSASCDEGFRQVVGNHGYRVEVLDSNHVLAAVE